MKLNLIRRVLMVTALSAVALTGAAVSADPLPVPDAPKLTVGVPAQDLLSPPDGVTVTYNTVFTWSNVGTPASFKLKIKILNTGQKFNVKATQANCHPGDFCTMAASAVPGLFNALENGYQIKWRVVAKYGALKSKSAPRTVTFETVGKPMNLQPANGSTLFPASTLSWNHNSANKSYVVIVKDANTGERLIKQKLSANACVEACEVMPNFEGGFPSAASLIWRVRAIGQNGDVAKSAKQTLSTLGFLISY